MISESGATFRHDASGLTFRRANDKTLELGSDLDLAGQPRALLYVVAEVEHVLFHRRRLSHHSAPRLLDIDVTGGAGASAAAFRLNSRDAVLDRRFHDRRAEIAVDGARRPFVIDIGDFRHAEGEERNFWGSAGPIAARSRGRQMRQPSRAKAAIASVARAGS